MGSGGMAPLFLTSALAGGERSGPGPFTPSESLQYPRDSMVYENEPQAGLDAVL
jgi:hypothetical protein